MSEHVSQQVGSICAPKKVWECVYPQNTFWLVLKYVVWVLEARFVAWERRLMVEETSQTSE
eukprot:3336210-Amphidinium_carterae.1